MNNFFTQNLLNNKSEIEHHSIRLVLHQKDEFYGKDVPGMMMLPLHDAFADFHSDETFALHQYRTTNPVPTPELLSFAVPAVRS